MEKFSMKNIILFTIIAITVVIIIGISIYFVFFQGKQKSPIVGEEDNGEELQIEKYEELKNSFERSFSNSVRKNLTISKLPEKVDETKDFVYSKYEIKLHSENRYDMEVNIPYINIKAKGIDEINKDIDETFGSKVNSIIQSKDMLSIYNLDYVFYLNDDMFSLVIKATLKENEQAQRLIIKTYNYSFERQEQLSLGSLIVRNGLDKVKVQDKINFTIKEIATVNKALEESGYHVYRRDIADPRYVLSNIDTFFIDQSGYLYIVFAYGNKSYTSELDLAIF